MANSPLSKKNLCFVEIAFKISLNMNPKGKTILGKTIQKTSLINFLNAPKMDKPQPKTKAHAKTRRLKEHAKRSMNGIHKTRIGLERIKLFFAETLRLCAFA